MIAKAVADDERIERKINGNVEEREGSNDPGSTRAM
jgi:hypothetical protein